jgi:hypothetical protein
MRNISPLLLRSFIPWLFTCITCGTQGQWCVTYSHFYIDIGFIGYLTVLNVVARDLYAQHIAYSITLFGSLIIKLY